jgi:CHAT domain-containing protein/tetratricopeptide (TPR) repeat protein
VTGARDPFAIADLLALPAHTDKISYLRAEGLANEHGLEWVLDRAEECVHDDPQATSLLTDLCRVAARTLGLAEVGARAAYLEARVCAEQGTLGAALTLIVEARGLWTESGHAVQAARTDLGRMQILDDLGRHTEAVEVGTRLIEELDRMPESDSNELRQWIRAAALENVGVAAGFTGDHERALEAYEQAEQAYVALGMPEETARPRANRGIELSELGRTGEALAILRSAEASFRDAGDRMWSAKCAGNIASVLEQRGELYEALRTLEPARQTLAELGAGVEAVRLQVAIARVYLAVGLGAEARTEADAACGKALELGLVHDAAAARFTAALGHAAEGNFSEADSEIKAAAELFDQVGDQQYLARTALVEADLADAQQRPDDARRRAEEASRLLADGGWRIPLTWAQLRCFDTATDRASADDHLRRAAALADELRVPQLQYECDLRTARVQRGRGLEANAEQVLRRAIGLVEQAGANLPDPQLRRAFRADRLAAHDELIDLLVSRGGEGDLVNALVVADRSKNQTLEELRSRTFGGRRKQNASVAEDDDDVLQADLNAIYAALISAEPRRAASLQARAGELERQISARRIRTVAIADAEPALGIGPRAGDLPAVEAAVQFHVLGDDVAVFVLRDGEVRTRRLRSIMPGVKAELDRLTAQWSRFRMGTAFASRHMAALTDTCTEILQALYRLLIAPVESDLVGLRTDRLVVVPSRALHQVPFHALHDGQGFLAERWTVTLAPSLGSRTRTRPAETSRAVVLAVPDGSAPAVVPEAAALKELLPGALVLVGADATTEALKSAVPGPGLLHLACHGLFRSANPLFSSLRLADRWLTAAEVLELDLKGAVVTLSACESGRQDAAAEPVGLGWAFLAAGADALLVSQWVVHDVVTADLMTEVYRGLAQGTEPAQALRNAQRKIMAHHPHPYYWAPFASVAPALRTEHGVAHDSLAPS